jgi:predicted nucleotidyltransferase
VGGFPLSRLLKGKLLRIAETQDAVITYPISRGVEFVLHGGTAVWRIYGGKRGSIDVDVYAENPELRLPASSARESSGTSAWRST